MSDYKALSRISEPGSESRASSQSAEKTTPEKSRVGFLTTWNQECGLATFARYLIQQFEPGSYVVLAEDTQERRKGQDEDYVHRCWKKNSSDWSALRELIQKKRLRLIHINAHARFFDQPSFSTLLREMRQQGVKVVTHLHSVFTQDKHLSQLLSQSDRIIAHTPETRLEAISAGAKPEDVQLIPHGVHIWGRPSEAERNQIRNSAGVLAGEKLIVAFGFIQPHKGMEGVIEAVSELTRQGVPCRGIIAGKINDDDTGSAKYLGDLKALAASSRISDRIQFLDRFLSDDEVAGYLSAADVVLMNYRSGHFESSGACALAIGAGALVATSTAPPFATFGDAVWHITNGFPPALSIALLLTNEKLAAEIRANACRYAEANSWGEVQKWVLQLYRSLGFEPAVTIEEKAVKGESGSGMRSRSGLKVLMQNRPNTFSQRGGDTVLLEKTKEGLEKLGVEVTVDIEARLNPADFDLLHLFNFALPQYIKPLAERAKQANTPFVVTTLCEDVPKFHNQSAALARELVEYVSAGQDVSWLERRRSNPTHTQPCAPFDNQWVAENAAALLTNGSRESFVVNQTYGVQGNIREVSLGYEVGAPGDPQLFINTYGVENFVLCVGRFESRKNQLMLLKALEHSNFPVVLVGGGFSYQPDYDRAVREFKRKGKTIILERISSEMLASAYAAAKVHAIPSWYELPGLVSLEAAWYGCNVVATENGTCRDYLGDLAFYCDPSDENSILNAVTAGYYSPVHVNLKQRVSQFTWDKTAEQTLQVYMEVCGAGVVASSAQSQSEWESWLESGEQAAREHHYTLAHEYLDKALAANPRSVRAVRAKAAVYMAGKDQGKAREYFEKAYDLDPKDSKTLSGLGMCEMMAQRPEQAFPFFVRALDIDFDHIVAILQLIECSYIIDKYDDLGRILGKYISKHPEDLDMQYCYAGCLFKQEHFALAEEVLAVVLRASPNHLGANELAEKLRARKAIPSAVRSDVAAVEVQPSTTEVATFNHFISSPSPQRQSIHHEVDKVVSGHGSTGASWNVAERLGAIAEAKSRREFEEVLEGCDQVLAHPGVREDERQTARLLRAEALVFLERTDESESIFKQVLTEEPENARALCGIGAILASRGEWDAAKECFEKAKHLQPSSDVALAGLGMFAEKDQDPDEAWRYYLSAAKLNPENTSALLGLIRHSYALNKHPELERALKNYLEMHPADLNFLYSLAGCYFAQEKLEEALDEVNKVILFEPQNERACELRLMIDEKLNASAVRV